MRKGFTLVELSIVLVIIGLLIGGILVAQSMVGTSRIVAGAGQIEQFDAAMENFKTKYKYLPGDAPSFGGNGDGLVAGCCTNNQNITVFVGETANYWNNAMPDQFAAASYSNPGSRAVAVGANKNVPLSKFGTGGAFYITSADGKVGTVDYADTVTPRNFYVLLAASQCQAIIGYGNYHFATSTSSNSAALPVDLLAMDKKIDDGRADSGNVLSGSIGDYTGSGIGGPVPYPLTGYCSSGANYLTTHSANECTPIIRMGSQVSDLQ